MDEVQENPRKALAKDSLIESLYLAHVPELLKYARLHVDSREDAEDIVLAVFVAALEANILQLRGEKEQMAWLWRVEKNKLADYQRRTIRHISMRLEAFEGSVYIDSSRQPDEVALRGEEYAELRAVLGELPILQQKIVFLRFGREMRCKEIAQRLNKSEGAVRMLLSRTLNILRHKYERQAKGDMSDG